MIRFAAICVLLVVAGICLFTRSASASIMASNSSATSWAALSGEAGDDVAVRENTGAGRAPKSTDPVPDEDSSVDVARGVNSTSGTSAPPGPTSSGSPVAAVVLSLDIPRHELVVRLAVDAALIFANPPPTSLLRPPRL